MVGTSVDVSFVRGDIQSHYEYGKNGLVKSSENTYLIKITGVYLTSIDHSRD